MRHGHAQALIAIAVTNADESVDFRVQLRGRVWRVDTSRAHDLSIPLNFAGPQPNFFDAPHATARPLEAGTFVGDVRTGGSCNCATYELTPHCNGTHTECVGHISRERVAIRDIPIPPYAIARLVTLGATPAASVSETTDPSPRPDDPLLTCASLHGALRDDPLTDAIALIVRTTPNPPSKQQQRFGISPPPPYFTAEFMQSLVMNGIQHLIVDLPSIDRVEDAGRLTAHRIFFGLPAGSSSAAQATRGRATITELAYIDDAIPDGWYVLNLQIAPFVADAAPSRPLLLPLIPS
jgi:arylformamidase